MQDREEKNENWLPKIIKIFSFPDQNLESAMEVDEENTLSKEKKIDNIYNLCLMYMVII